MLRRSLLRFSGTVEEKTLFDVVSEMRERTAVRKTSSTRRNPPPSRTRRNNSSDLQQQQHHERPSRSPVSKIGLRDMHIVGGSTFLRLSSSNPLGQKLLFPFLERHQDSGQSSNRALVLPALLFAGGAVSSLVVFPAVFGIKATLSVFSFLGLSGLMWKLACRVQQLNVGVLLGCIVAFYAILAAAQQRDKSASAAHISTSSASSPSVISESVFSEKQPAAKRAEPFATDAEPSAAAGTLMLLPLSLERQERNLFGPRADPSLWISVCQPVSAAGSIDAMLRGGDNNDDDEDDRDALFDLYATQRSRARTLPDFIQAEVSSTASALEYVSKLADGEGAGTALVVPTILAGVLRPVERDLSFETPYSRR